MIIILVGPPGSGKGTQSDLLVNHLKAKHIAVGDILREEIQKGSELGKRAQAIIDKGHLMDDQTVSEIVESRLNYDDRYIILDGYPRTVGQAEILETVVNNKKLGPIKVLYFELDLQDPRLQERFANRFNCNNCGKVYNSKTNPPKVKGECDACHSRDFGVRADDTQEVFEQRLKNYASKTQSVIDFYKRNGVLYSIDAGKNKHEVYEDVVKIVQE